MMVDVTPRQSRNKTIQEELLVSDGAKRTMVMANA
jgi:hypothetical protein